MKIKWTKNIIKTGGLVFVGMMLAMGAQAREGGFAGVQGGWMDSNTELTLEEPGVGKVSIDGLDADGFVGGAFIGYGWRGISGFFAVEANLGVSNAKADLKDGDYKGELEAGTTYGAGVLMGRDLVGDGAVFLRLGWQETEFELSERYPSMGYAWSKEKRHGGPRAGIGVVLPASPTLDWRLEWYKTWYEDLDYSDVPGMEVVLEPTESIFSAGVSFRF